MNFQQAVDNLPTVSHFFNPNLSTLPLYLESVNKIITLRNIQGRLTNKAVIIPTQNAQTGEFYGVERLSQQQKDGKAYAVDKRRKITVTDGTTFDLSDDVQRTDWNWVQYSIYIVQTKHDALMSPNALFYVEDSERDTNDKLKKGEIFFQAENLIRNEWSEPVRMNRARLLGHDLSMHTQAEILEYLIDFARTSIPNAQKILEIEADPYKQERLELLRWKDVDLVVEKAGGAWFFGEFRMGTDEHSAIAWVLQVENREVVRTIRDRFGAMQRPNLSGVQNIPTRGGLKPATEANGQPRSTSVQPIMQSPRPAVAPNALTLEKVKQLAPIGYAELEAAQTPAIMAYLAENPDEELFRQMVKEEMSKNILFKRAQAQPTPPVLATEVSPEVIRLRSEVVEHAPAPNLGAANDLYDDNGKLEGSGIAENAHFYEVVTDSDTGEQLNLPPLLDQPDHENAPVVEGVPLGDDGQPLKGLALVNYQRQQAKKNPQDTSQQ